MDDARFDLLTRRFGQPSSRRAALRLVAGLVSAGAAGGLAAGRVAAKHKKPKTCPQGRLCDSASGICCPKKSVCCNPDSPDAACCPQPNACAKPYGDEAAPYACCPPERTWAGRNGARVCCPAGTRTLPHGAVSTNGGPCCPEAAYCGGVCCASGATCLDPTHQLCCPDGATQCGKTCCGGDCCGGVCCPSAASCWGCVDGTCQDLCPASVGYCSNGVCKHCTPTCGG